MIVLSWAAPLCVAILAVLVLGGVKAKVIPVRRPTRITRGSTTAPVSHARPPPIAPRIIRRATEKRRQRTLDRTYPDALELFVVSLQAGAMPIEAMRLLAVHADSLVAAAFADSCRQIDRGQMLDAALDVLVTHLGPRSLTLAATIRSSWRTGLPLAPMLERLADDARQHRRRHAEMSARELPVRLTFPLVLCTLPAFVLVAVAPLLIGALSSLRSA
ncbi:MAG: putative type secretion system protein [Actinomycetota bacterium]